MNFVCSFENALKKAWMFGDFQVWEAENLRVAISVIGILRGEVCASITHRLLVYQHKVGGRVSTNMRVYRTRQLFKLHSERVGSTSSRGLLSNEGIKRDLLG